MLTIGNIKAIIEEAKTWIGMMDETEIRIVGQPSWSIEYSLDSTAYRVTVFGSSQERPKREDFDSDADYLAAHLLWMDRTNGEPVLYLAVGQQLGYLLEEVRDRIGWTEG